MAHLNEEEIDLLRHPELDWTEQEKQILFDVIRSTRSDDPTLWTPIDRCLFAKKHLPHKTLRDIAWRCNHLFEQEHKIHEARRNLLEPSLAENLSYASLSQLAPVSLFVQLRGAELSLDKAESLIAEQSQPVELMELLQRTSLILHRCGVMVRELPQATRMCGLPEISLTPFPLHVRAQISLETARMDGFQLLTEEHVDPGEVPEPGGLVSSIQNHVNNNNSNSSNFNSSLLMRGVPSGAAPAMPGAGGMFPGGMVPPPAGGGFPFIPQQQVQQQPAMFPTAGAGADDQSKMLMNQQWMAWMYLQQQQQYQMMLQQQGGK